MVLYIPFKLTPQQSIHLRVNSCNAASQQFLPHPSTVSSTVYVTTPIQFTSLNYSRLSSWRIPLYSTLHHLFRYTPLRLIPLNSTPTWIDYCSSSSQVAYVSSLYVTPILRSNKKCIQPLCSPTLPPTFPPIIRPSTRHPFRTTFASSSTCPSFISVSPPPSFSRPCCPCSVSPLCNPLCMTSTHAGPCPTSHAPL